MKAFRLKTPIKKNHIRTDYRIYKFLVSHAYEKAEEALSLKDENGDDRAGD